MTIASAIAMSALFASHAIAQPAPSPWSHIQVATDVALGDRFIAVPSEGFDEWSRTRSSSALGTDSMPLSSARVTERARWLLASQADGHLGWERALNAAASELGLVPVAIARAWDDVLLGRLPESAGLRQDVAWATFYEYGSAVAALPPGCFSADEDALEMVEELVVAELSVPEYRFRSRLEEAVAVPRASRVESVLEEDSNAEVVLQAAAIAVHALGTADEDWVMEIAENGESVVGCSMAPVALAARLGTLSPAQWSDERDAINALIETTTLPRRVLWRALVYQYLWANRDAVQLLSVAFDEQYPGDATVPYAAALRLAVTGNIDQMGSVLDAADPSDRPTERWVFAEYYRLSGSMETAFATLNSLVREDTFFGAALLSRISTFHLTGQADLAYADLQHVRMTSSNDPVVDRWIDAFDARLGNP